MPLPRIDRRDKRGRRIGYNWWRDYNCSVLHDASLVWERQAEEASNGWATELAEYAADNPRPNLKQFLLANKGMNAQPETHVVIQFESKTGQTVSGNPSESDTSVNAETSTSELDTSQESESSWLMQTA